LGLQRSAQDWLAIAQAQLAGHELAAARATLAQALSEHPGARDLRRAQAGVLQRMGRSNEAESQFRGLLEAEPGDVASAFSLAAMLKEQGRTAATASILRACVAQPSNDRDAELAIRAIELLDDCDRKADAAAIAADAIEAHPNDARLHAYAGMLQIQLGEFEGARRHYLFALQHDERAWEWSVPIGLASTQRYRDSDHADFALLRGGLQRDGLSGKARAELHFALGKAHDDAGDHERAARHFREGNAMAHRLTSWSRKAWRRAIEARLAAPAHGQQLAPTPGFMPVFIVGMPRSGTTLLAERLARYRGVRNRGEQPWLGRFALQADLDGAPRRDALERAAETYVCRVRQDDAAGAQWFIDKQPLNFRYVDLALGLFPDAKIVYCQRNQRDNALSLWMQCFREDVQGYSYDFGDIAVVMHDCERLMVHWQRRFPAAIRSVRYERLVAAPRETVSELAEWIGLPPPDTGANDDIATGSTNTISTASLWQARQPIHTRSVNRSQAYLPFLPELARFTGT
jgi:tetratricopeptide (TPR) repeat protein